MPTGIVLIPLFAGYIVLHTCFLSRFRAQRQDGYHLLIESVLAGIPISFSAWILAALVHSREWDFLGIEASFGRAPVPYLGTAFLAGLIAAIAGGLVNLLFPPGKAKWYLIKRNDDGFLRLTHQAVREEKPISTTLKNKKVYIGFVVQTPGLRPGEQYISILPLASGYRESDTLDLVLTQDYTRVYDRTDIVPSEFAVTFPLSEIESASLFNPAAYPLFQDSGLESHGKPLAAVASAAK